MKVKVHSDDTSILRKHGWPQMGGWLAQLRDDSRGEPPEDHAGEDGAEDRARTEARARAHVDARAQAEALARAQTQARAQAEALARAQTQACAQTEASATATERAVIGDQLRMPIMWCEMGSCASWYADPEALGEADTRTRAIGAGWRIDALGRLACPRCLQTDPRFWADCPVVPQDRYTAIATAGRAAILPGDRTTGSAGETSREPDRSVCGYPPVSGAKLEWHHDVPAAQVMRADWSAERPPRVPVPTAWP